MNPEHWTKTLIFTVRYINRLFAEKVYCFLFYWFQYKMAWVEIGLFWQYPILSPQYANRKFLKKHNLNQSFLFGETPLSALASIFDKIDIPKGMIIFDVGCGWGRSTFFLHNYTQAHRTVGIDIQPDFIKKAEKIRKWLRRDYMVFLKADIREIDYQDADVIYLYGTCLEPQIIKDLAKKWDTELASGTIIITTSYSLNTYAENSRIILRKCIPIRYLWGECDVYYHQIISDSSEKTEEDVTKVNSE